MAWILILSFLIKQKKATVNDMAHIIDGKIINGEWDIFYEYAKDEETVTTYANWDFYNLYLGYSANNVEGVAICIDLNSDGWVIGDDNYLITSNENNEFDILKTVKNADNGITLISIKAPEDTKITAVKQTVNGKENMEIAIPAGIFGNGGGGPRPGNGGPQ